MRLLTQYTVLLCIAMTTKYTLMYRIIIISYLHHLSAPPPTTSTTTMTILHFTYCCNSGYACTNSSPFITLHGNSYPPVLLLCSSQLCNDSPKKGLAGGTTLSCKLVYLARAYISFTWPCCVRTYVRMSEVPPPLCCRT